MSIRQQTSAQFLNGSGAVTLTLPSVAVAANAILVVLNGYNGGGSVTATVTDDKSGGSNSYTTDAATNAAARTMFFYAPNIGACQTITLTPGGSINGFWQAFEIDNVPTSSILAATSVFYTDSDSSPNASVTTAAPSQATNIVFAACATREDFMVTPTLGDPTSGHTRLQLDTSTVGASISSSIAYKSGNASAQSATWTHSTGAPGSAGIIVIKQNAGGSAVPTIVRNYLR